MKSSLGNIYVLIMYVYDDNEIIKEPFKSRSGIHILESYTNQVGHLKNRGYIPLLHWLENKALDSLNKYNRQEYIGYQLVPPHINRVNASERVIRTRKDHLIVGLASTDTRFPTNM